MEFLLDLGSSLKLHTQFPSQGTREFSTRKTNSNMSYHMPCPGSWVTAPQTNAIFLMIDVHVDK